MAETYRFGQRRYGLAEIRGIGERHGEHDVIYYPPQDWDRRPRERKRVSLLPENTLEAAYREGYRAGYYRRHPAATEVTP